MRTSAEAFQTRDLRPAGRIVIEAEAMRIGENDPALDWLVGATDILPDEKNRGAWIPGEALTLAGIRLSALLYVNERFGPEPMALRLLLPIDGIWTVVSLVSTDARFLSDWARNEAASKLPLDFVAWRFLPGTPHHQISRSRPAGWSHTAESFREHLQFKAMMLKGEARGELEAVINQGQRNMVELRLVG